MAGGEPYTYAFGGGLDLASAALAVPPSALIASINYEPLAEGYGRIEGYERFDGRALPSQQPFWSMPFELGGNVIADGALIEGATSGATARVILPPQDFAGSWDAGTAGGTLVLADLTGTFLAGEVLRVGGWPAAVAMGLPAQDAASTAEALRAWRTAAQEWRRATIGKVPGIGPVRGVAVLGGVLYAWRDHNTAEARVYRATATGWELVPQSWRIFYGNASAPIGEGRFIEQNTWSVYVERDIKTGGSYTDGTASGVLILSGPLRPIVPGPFFGDGGARLADASAPSEPIFFEPSGRYDFLRHNFYGSADRMRLYGANGEGPGFEFDGQVVVPILTGVSQDRPTRVSQIANHLLFAYRGGAVMFSAPGEPLVFDAIEGAGEIGIGSEVTNIIAANDSATVITAADRIATLQGRDADSFQLDILTDEAGADAWSAAKVGTTLYVDRRGLRSLTSTSAFGNFKTGTLSERVESYFRNKRAAGVSVVAAYVSRPKSQYRIIWSDGTSLFAYMGRKNAEFLPVSHGTLRPFSITTTEMEDGSEAIYVGAEDGYVYRLDSGNSFDGQRIRYFGMTPFNHLGLASLMKRIHGVRVEVQAGSDYGLRAFAQFDYGDGTQPEAGGDFSIPVAGGGGVWDASVWNDFNWSAGFESTGSCDLDGIGRNVSIVFGGEAEPTEKPHVLQAYTVLASRRRPVR